MSQPAPCIASQTSSPRAYVRIQQLQALAVTDRAFQLGCKVFAHCTMRKAKLIRQRLNIKFSVSAARMTVRRDDLTTAQAITQCRVRAECTHDSLQGWLSYTVNKERTNHIFQEVIYE
ncbi:hypothetical protein F9K94_15560 [Brucella tritici]|uniref:Uncharacterized protein n=1 Tax=Brucella tritici TaxID=94626 RepID=A0A7V7VS47_9HYPH|nr:hypothetical protein [Brucella tritici]KAB2655942.1 hypothetical protein F9K94_15560 [Brucella tritici]